MQACGWNSLVDYFDVETHDMERKYDNEEGDWNWAYTFPKISGYKIGSDITEGDITEVKVYLHTKRKTFLDPHKVNKKKTSK